jgi:hypothetical protein
LDGEVGIIFSEVFGRYLSGQVLAAELGSGCGLDEQGY